MLGKFRKAITPSKEDTNQSVLGFCFGASGESELACEVMLGDPHHPTGVLTGMMMAALAEMNYQCTYKELLEAMEKKRAMLVKQRVQFLDQHFVLTCTSEAEPEATEFLMPLGRGVFKERASKPVRQRGPAELVSSVVHQLSVHNSLHFGGR